MKNLRKYWLKYGWDVALISGVFVAGVLGFLGFHKLDTDSPSFGDILYQTLQLFTLESGLTDKKLADNWELQIARFLAPIMAVFSAIRVFLHVTWQTIRLRFTRHHVVICGLGHKGLRLVEAFLKKGKRVVAIESDENNDWIGTCEDQGVLVLMGDAADKHLLQKAGVDRAQYLIAVCSDDGANVEIAVRAYELWSQRKRGRKTDDRLTCLIHLANFELCDLLEQHKQAAQEDETFDLKIFNVFASGARALLANHPPQLPSTPVDVDTHLVVIGFGRMGENLMINAARFGAFELCASGKKLRITVVDGEANEKKKLLRLRYPQLDKVCEVQFHQMDIDSPEFHQANFSLNDAEVFGGTTVYICPEDEVRGMSSALNLLQQTAKHQFPIVVCMTQDTGLIAPLQRRNRNLDGVERLRAFCVVDLTCNLEVLLEDEQDQLARAIHEHYVEEEREKGETSETNPSLVKWEALPEDLKQSNRQAADHIAVKLRAIGCGHRRVKDRQPRLFKFTPEEVEQLSEMEHLRWCADKYLDGWRYGPKRDSVNKVRPDLVEWEQLDLLKGTLLFRIGLEFEGDFNKGVLSEDLRQKFLNHTISLSQDAKVLFKEKSSPWLIADEKHKQTYTVRRERQQLNIFEEDIKDKDRRQVRNIPLYLAGVGHEIYRLKSE